MCQKGYILQFSLLIFRKFNFQLFYHGCIYNLSYAKISQNPFPAIMAMSLKLNYKSITDIFPGCGALVASTVLWQI